MKFELFFDFSLFCSVVGLNLLLYLCNYSLSFRFSIKCLPHILHDTALEAADHHCLSVVCLSHLWVWISSDPKWIGPLVELICDNFFLTAKKAPFWDLCLIFWASCTHCQAFWNQRWLWNVMGGFSSKPTFCDWQVTWEHIKKLVFITCSLSGPTAATILDWKFLILLSLWILDLCLVMRCLKRWTPNL